jgi:hypothetical protein
MRYVSASYQTKISLGPQYQDHIDVIFEKKDRMPISGGYESFKNDPVPVPDDMFKS